MGNAPSSLARCTQQDPDRKGSEPNVHVNLDDMVNTKHGETVSPKIDGTVMATFDDTIDTVIDNATDGERTAPSEQATTQTQTKIGRNQRARKRKRKRPGQSRASLGFLHRRFKYLPLDLKKSMRNLYKMYALHNQHLGEQDTTSGRPQESQPPMTPTPAYTFVVKETRPVQCKSKRRPQVAIHPEVLSTHPTAWEANVAVLELLHESCGREGWDLEKCCMCGSTQRDYKVLVDR